MMLRLLIPTVVQSTVMLGKIGLEEHFAIPETVDVSKGPLPTDSWEELRMRSSSQLSVGNGPFETSTVSGIAKCSSRPIFPSMTVLWTTVGMRSLSIIYRRLAKLGIK